MASASPGRTSSRYLLNHLTVKAAHLDGYDRSKFRLWTSQGNGCDTRDTVLIAEAVKKPTVGSGCTLDGGEWFSKYDGLTTTDPSTFDIDHLVPLAEAWRSGAWKWDADTRTRYANDLGYAPDLIAVTAHENRSKGDQQPQDYLPPRASFDCKYMAWWVAVKYRWHLKVDTTEESFLRTHLRACDWPTIATPSRPAIGNGSTSSGGSGGTGSTTGCTRTSTGSCAAAGQFCPSDKRGQYGYDANGRRLYCGNDGHWHYA